MQLGVCYYPEQWDPSMWESDARRMAEAGISHVRIAEFAWSRIEPEQGRFDWAWLDQSIAILVRHGLKIILGTPTAAAPKWLVDAHPEVLAVDAAGKRYNFGSRRHADIGSDAYRQACVRVVTAMVLRYGEHPAVIAWQTDNELCCHSTIPSYSPALRTRFQGWLQQRYARIDALNTAWQNVFWSMEYPAFAAIELPINLPTDANPIHLLDFRRFVSAEVAGFHKLQADILRRHAPGRDILHNFMGFFTAFDHYEFQRDGGIDVAAWDSYPIARAEVLPFSDEEKSRWMRTGHPDVTALSHDLYRGVGKGRFWVMEQQAGPVNWAPWNPVPLPGMVRLWTLEACAHGAELVSYFRWRQNPAAQEQMHSGLNRPDNQLSQGGHEVLQVSGELAALAAAMPAPAAAPARKVALLFDYQADWIYSIQPHGKTFDYQMLVLAYYQALRELDLDIDVVSPEADLSGYQLVVAPSLPTLSEGMMQQLAASDAVWAFGPRSGSKTPEFAIPPTLPPGPLQAVLPIKVLQVESLRPGAQPSVLLQQHWGRGMHWRDHLEVGAGAEVMAAFEDGLPAIVRAGRVHFLASCFDADFLRHVLHQLASAAGLAPQRLPDGVRRRRRGQVCFEFNYGPGDHHLGAQQRERLLIGDAVLKPGGAAAWLMA